MSDSNPTVEVMAIHGHRCEGVLQTAPYGLRSLREDCPKGGEPRCLCSAPQECLFFRGFWTQPKTKSFVVLCEHPKVRP